MKNLLAITVLVALHGCDALTARMRAADGAAAYRGGKIDAAKLYGEAAQSAPRQPAIQLNLGFAELGIFQANPTSVAGQQAAKAAIAAFEQYLTLVPGEERARSYLIQTFIDAGQYEAALAYFKPEIERTPPSGEALATLSSIAAKTGHFAEAREWQHKRIAADPTNADARISLGVLLWDHLHTHPTIVGDERLQMADDGIASLKEAIRLKPNAPNAYTYTTLLFGERAVGQKLDQKARRPDSSAAIREASRSEEQGRHRSEADHGCETGEDNDSQSHPKKGQALMASLSLIPNHPRISAWLHWRPWRLKLPEPFPHRSVETLASWRPIIPEPSPHRSPNWRRALMASGFAAFDDAPARPGRRRLAVVSVAAHVLFGVGLFIASIPASREEIAPPTLSLTFLSAAPPPPPPPPPTRRQLEAQDPADQDRSEADRDQARRAEQRDAQKKTAAARTTRRRPSRRCRRRRQRWRGRWRRGRRDCTGTDGPKMVLSFTLAAQQLTHPDPHLPDWFLNQHPAQTVKGTYKVCIGTDGKIASVTTMVGIGGVDDIVSDHIRKEWTYKPQPVPVRTASVVVFKIK